MKIYNRGPIAAGLIIFAVLVMSPFLLNIGGGKMPVVKLDTPEISKLEVKTCVAQRAFMREKHMKVLDDWKDSVVRRGERGTIQAGDRAWDKSLQNGCLKCHSNKAGFCDACHASLSVKPTCWECHIAPKEKKL